MEIPQIKDKVTARAFALQMAYGAFHSEGGILGTAEKYANFIIGDAELPEVAEDYSTQIINMWSRLKEGMEKNEAETSKRLKELHDNLPLRANNHTEPKLEDIQNETH